MNLKGKRHIFQEEAGAAAGGGGAAAGGADAAAAAAAAAAAGANDGAAGAGAASLLPGANAAAGVDRFPEKLRVMKDDGTFDEAATTTKLLEVYGNLEKRMGSGGAPPATVDEYAPEGLPDGFSFDEVKADPMYQEFAKEAHAAGFNNAQMGLVLKAWQERAGAVAEASMNITLDQAKAELATAWGGPEKLAENLPLASQAVAAAAQKAGLTVEQVNEAGLGRNPTFLRLMAALGPEFKPDGATPIGVALNASDFDTQLAEIKAHPGFADDRHPEHKALMAKKAALYEKRYPSRAAPALTKP